MNRFGANVKTRIDEGEGIFHEIHLTYHCGCQYSAGCLDSGEGFDFFCEQHSSEADRIQNAINHLIWERDYVVTDEDADDIEQRIFELSAQRSSFYDLIKGR